VHESSYLLQHVVDFDAATRMLRRSNLIFAVSNNVRLTLERLVQPAAEIVVVPGFIPTHSTGTTAAALPASLERHLSTGKPIVAAVGTMSWYKGTDLFIVVAQRVRELLPDSDVTFVWVGEEWRTEVRHQVEHDVRLAGLDDVVLFPGTVADPLPLLRAASVFLLPSREDSWPLVMLEAAAEGVPMVCFAGSGGAEQFIATGGGTAVPYLDVEAMAQTVVAYLTDPDRRARESDAARAVSRLVDPREQIDTIASGLASCADRHEQGRGQT
jgi:glycosyltransferase involved in cell wall biosynthesis